jgi:hypothetical protein
VFELYLGDFLIMKKFNKILLKAAILSMAIDGEIHDKELAFIHQFSTENEYFKELNFEDFFNSITLAIRDNYEKFIEDFSDEVKKLSLDKNYTMILIDVIVAIILSDDKIENDEMLFLKKMTEIFEVDEALLISRYPNLKESYEKVTSTEMVGV